MTNIGQFGYGAVIKKIEYSPKKRATNNTSESNFSDSLPKIGTGVGSDSAELIGSVPERWTSARLYSWDSSPKGYSVNMSAISKVREQMNAEGIDADHRPPTHEITDEQMEWLNSRYDLEFINACSREHSEFGNFMLDLAYLNVFSLDEVENFFGVLPPTNEYQAVGLYYHGDPETGMGAGYVDIFGTSGEIIAPEKWQTRHITQYLKATYTNLTEKELKKMTGEIISATRERMDILEDILERSADRMSGSINSAFPRIENASAKLKEDFGGICKTDETLMDKLFKNAPDKWVTEPGIAHNAVKAAVEYRKNELGIKDPEPTHELTPEQREWLYSRHDLSTMQTRVRYSYEYGGTTQYRIKATAEYSNFLADLAYLGVYSAEEFIQVSPLDTRPGANSTLTEYFNELWNSDDNLLTSTRLFAEHLQNMFNFYSERSKSPLSAVEGDAEFAALIRENYLPFHQKFFEFIDELIKSEEHTDTAEKPKTELISSL